VCVCVFSALVIRHATCMPCVACTALPYFSTLSHKRHDFPKKSLSIKCVFSVSLQHSSETFLILRVIQPNVNMKIPMSSRKLPVIHVRFHRNIVFHDILSKNTQTSNFMTIRLVVAQLLDTDRLTDGQTDLT